MESINNEKLQIFVKDEALGEELFDWSQNLLPERFALKYYNLDLLADILVYLGFGGVAKIYDAKIPDYPEILYIQINDCMNVISREQIVIGSIDLNNVETPIVFLVDRGEMYQVEFFENEDNDGVLFDCTQLSKEDLK